MLFTEVLKYCILIANTIVLNKIKTIKSEQFTWTHILNPGENEIQYLRSHFSFHPLDLQDCVVVAQRPKLDVYDQYIFFVLLFPYYDRTSKIIGAGEIDFFLGPDYLITVSDGKHEAVQAFFDSCQQNDLIRRKHLTTSAELLSELLRRLQEGIFPMLDHITKDITTIEENIFNGREHQMVRDILNIKRNIANARRIMNAHRAVIKKFMKLEPHSGLSLKPDVLARFETIVEHTKEIWEILEIQKDTINAFHDANESLISFKLNDLMKSLTMISVSIFPATLIATLFGMNALSSTPFIHSPYGFWIIVGLILLNFVFFVWWFKQKKWL